jgi:hypothetical protein
MRRRSQREFFSMVNGNKKLRWVLAAGVAICVARAASAQTAVLTEMYGNGAHAYFAGDFKRAEADLTGAVNGGSQDPRVFYFRGFALLKLGRADEAESDFKAGAKFESEDINHFYPVGRSLERVQGAVRVSLERERSVARAVAYTREQQRNAARYEQYRRAEQHVLRQRPSQEDAAQAAGAAAAPEEEAAPARPTPKVAADAGAGDPFADNAAPAGGDMAAEKPAEQAAEDAFADAPKAAPPAKEAAAPASDDPFAEPPAKAAAPPAMEAEEPPAAAPPAGEPPAAKEEMPAKDPADQADPLSPEQPAAPAKPPAAPAAKPAAESDPFGAEEPAAPAKKPAATEEPAAAEPAAPSPAPAAASPAPAAPATKPAPKAADGDPFSAVEGAPATMPAKGAEGDLFGGADPPAAGAKKAAKPSDAGDPLAEAPVGPAAKPPAVNDPFGADEPFRAPAAKNPGDAVADSAMPGESAAKKPSKIVKKPAPAKIARKGQDDALGAANSGMPANNNPFADDPQQEIDSKTPAPTGAAAKRLARAKAEEEFNNNMGQGGFANPAMANPGMANPGMLNPNMGLGDPNQGIGPGGLPGMAPDGTGIGLNNDPFQ